jgi:FAD/FMN-containing dehydrogenase
MREATLAVESAYPAARVLAFGHMGDGNIHFNILLPDDGSAIGAQVNRTVHAIVARYRGSITAEHGIGRYRRDELPQHRTEMELRLMHAIKRAIDAQDLMNPGAVL